MSVAAHLGINLAEYDRRIRTFIPHYEEMLDVAAGAVPADARQIVDLGVGTGALAARCLKRAPRARLFAIDADPQILAVAARRIGRRATFAAGNFLRADIPRADVIVSSFALHHVRTRPAKLALYRRLRAATRRGGRCLIVDSLPATDRRLLADQLRAWGAHLRTRYTLRETRQIFTAWADEDVYMPLEIEIALMRAAGFAVEVVWRRDAFAILSGR